MLGILIFLYHCQRSSSLLATPSRNVLFPYLLTLKKKIMADEIAESGVTVLEKFTRRNEKLAHRSHLGFWTLTSCSPGVWFTHSAMYVNCNNSPPLLARCFASTFKNRAKTLGEHCPSLSVFHVKVLPPSSHRQLITCCFWLDFIAWESLLFYNAP